MPKPVVLLTYYRASIGCILLMYISVTDFSIIRVQINTIDIVLQTLLLRICITMNFIKRLLFRRL